ncbi:MAG TPA: hypothetical protein DIC30_02755 [Oceanospirillales bacterium]|nr:hypothetical protein [Oceanospirillales bacterium]|tara:strand:+ start:61 stop:648 length:588 start_codon:yes stop_codon:yes gene_type:complete
MIKIIIITLFALYLPQTKALEPLGEEELQQVLGQGGVYLSGDITINETGGPLNDMSDTTNPGIWQADCSVGSTNQRCGARLAVNAGDDSNSGWLVLDNIRGRFSFEGLTLKTRTIDSGFDDGGNGDSDGAVFDGDVLEIGLPNTLNYSDVSFTLANSNSARPTDAGFQQTDILNVNIDGDISLRGNLLLFPTGNP